MKVLCESFTYLVVILTLLLTFVDSKQRSDDDNMCADQLEYCDAPSILSDIPSNGEKLKQYCTALKRKASCMLTWTYECNNPFVSFFHMTYDFCTNSTLYEELKEHIECIYDGYKPHVNGESDCRKLFGSDTVVSQVQEAKTYLSQGELSNITNLLIAFNDLGCFLWKLKCPEAAIEIVREAHVRMYSRLIYWLEKLESKALSVRDDHFVNSVPQRIWVKTALVWYSNKCKELNCKTYESSTSQLLE